ncbi:hypothetical protein HKBW3S06_01493, partial [Candidatus Hakubella thermalkaliphila]
VIGKLCLSTLRVVDERGQREHTVWHLKGKPMARRVVEELLSGSATLGQLSRRHEISSGLIGHWPMARREATVCWG